MQSTYNPEIWSDLTLEERNIYYIAEAFLKFAKSRGDYKKYLPLATSKISRRDQYLIDEGEMYAGDKIRNHKNWQYFERLWERFKDDQLFDADVYMKSISRHLPKEKHIYPAQLTTKKNIADYLEYRESLKLTSKTDDVKRIMQGIVQTYKLIERKVGISPLKQEDLYSFFNSAKDNNIISEGLLLCVQEMISPYYYAVSKSFLVAYKNADKEIQDEILPLDRLKDMSILVRSNSRIYGFLKKIFSGDIM